MLNSVYLGSEKVLLLKVKTWQPTITPHKCILPHHANMPYVCIVSSQHSFAIKAPMDKMRTKEGEDKP